MKRKESKFSFAKTVFCIVPMQYKAAPWLTTLSNLLLIIMALASVAVIAATQGLFDAIAGAASGRSEFWDCATPLLILAGITFGLEINNGLYWFLTDVIIGKCAGKCKLILFRKLHRLNPANFEAPDFLDDVNKSKEGVYVITYFCLFSYALILNYPLYFTVVGIYLFRLKPILLFTLLLSFFPAFLAYFFRIKVFIELEQESAPLRREHEYYQKTLCDREYFKETRILGAFHFFHNLFSETLLILTHKIWQVERKNALLQLGLNFTSFAGMSISAYLLFTATMSGEISVGAFAAVFAALGSIFGWMQAMITQHLGNMIKYFGKVYHFLRVMDMPEVSGVEAKPDLSKGVIAKNICFTYPGRDEPAVKNVSLTIAKDETIAIVGENGAGKSTLVRLLTGIYRPSEGTIILGGLDTMNTAPKSLYQGISGVFQKYQRYKMTLGENVTISNTKTELDDVRVESVLCEAGAELEGIVLTDMLSPEFEGIDLSGGQWQRLAIARGLYRINGFIVLDEPTAAIDPIEETRVYTQFQQLAVGKCAVIVTHRLGSAKLANRIVVMNAGKIVDIGTHDELLNRSGKYADMWKAQAVWYEREPIPH